MDDQLKRRLDALAARKHKPLSDWAAEELGRLAADANEDESTSGYSAEWMKTFGAIIDPEFRAPERHFPHRVQALDSEF